MKTRLSASRIKTFNECSQRYYAQYVLKVPEKSNTGAQKGSVVHDILEVLLNEKHKSVVEKVLEDKTCKKHPALWRYIKRRATIHSVNIEAELDVIDKFIIVALGHNFYGPEGTKYVLGEKEFDIVHEKDDKKYWIKGFIDKTFVIETEDRGEFIEAIDYKSSKAKYDKEESESNIQSQMYQLALRHLYPNIKERRFDFLFLKFAKNPILEQATLTDEQLDGFEYYLTYLQEQFDSFNEKNAKDNLAVFDEKRKWLCGKEGTKKDGTAAFICPFRKPKYYYVLLDNEDKIIETSDNEIAPNGSLKVERRFYSGCPYFFNEKGDKRNFQR